MPPKGADSLQKLHDPRKMLPVEGTGLEGVPPEPLYWIYQWLCSGWHPVVVARGIFNRFHLALDPNAIQEYFLRIPQEEIPRSSAILQCLRQGKYIVHDTIADLHMLVSLAEEKLQDLVMSGTDEPEESLRIQEATAQLFDQLERLTDLELRLGISPYAPKAEHREVSAEEAGIKSVREILKMGKDSRIRMAIEIEPEHRGRHSVDGEMHVLPEDDDHQEKDNDEHPQ